MKKPTAAMVAAAGFAALNAMASAEWRESWVPGRFEKAREGYAWKIREAKNRVKDRIRNGDKDE